MNFSPWISRIYSSLRKNRQLIALLSFSQIFNLLLGMLNSVLWTRYMSTETYGSYQLVLSLIGIVATFCLSGLSQSASISAARGLDGNYRLILSQKFKVSCVGTLGLFALGAHYWLKEHRDIAMGLFLLAPCFFGAIASEITLPWLTSKREFRLVSIYQSLPTLISTVGLSTAIWTDHRAFVQVLSLTQVLLFAVNAWIAVRIRKTHCFNEEKDLGVIRYGYHVTAASLLGFTVYLDKVIVYERLSASDMAIYAVALIFPAQLKILYAIAGQVISPAINAAFSVKEAWFSVRFKVLSLIGIFSVIGMVGFVLIPTLIPLLFSVKYVEASAYGKWMFLAFALAAPGAYFGNILRAQQKTKFFYFYEFVQPISSVALYFVLVPYGLIGMTIAQVIRQIFWGFFMIFAMFFYLKREASSESR